MCDTPAHSPAAQDARGQTKISDYFSAISSSHASQQPGAPFQRVTNSSCERQLKSNEKEDGVRSISNLNANLMDFEPTEQGDTASYSPAMEIDESTTDATSAAVDVERPNIVTANPVKQSEAGNNGKRKNKRGGRKHKKRPIGKGLGVGAALTKQGDTVPPASATETGESVKNLATSRDICPTKDMTSPSKGNVKPEPKFRTGLRMSRKEFDLDASLSDDEEGSTVSHSPGRESKTSTAPAGAHLNKRSLDERSDTAAAVSGVVAKKAKMNPSRPNTRSERRAQRHAARLSGKNSNDDYRRWQKKESWSHFGDESDPDNGSAEDNILPVAHESNTGMNLEFYRNKVRSVPDGDFIENILSEWKNDFKKLEKHHGYIQWLFPLKEIGMNNMAPVLKEEEAKAMREDPILSGRILRSYKMMLGFYGLVIMDDKLGVVGPSDLFQKRMENLNSSFHNNLRITRILKSLGELGFEHMKKPLLLFLANEAFVTNKLVNCRRSFVTYWIPTLKSKQEKEFIEQMVKDLEQREQRQAPKYRY